MQKSLEYVELNFTEEDLEYSQTIINKVQEISKEIVEFFEIKDFGSKVVARFWNSLEDFRTYLKEVSQKEECPDYVCGFCNYVNEIEYIEILSLKEYRKTKSHENGTIEDLCYLVLHEFAHACQRKYKKTKCYTWLSEGCATTISHQFEKYPKVMNATLEQMQYGRTNYNNYHTMFYYVYKKYGRDYILNLMANFALQEKETPRLYKELKQTYKK